MASTAEGHGPKNPSKDMAPGASHDALERLEKLSEKSDEKVRENGADRCSNGGKAEFVNSKEKSKVCDISFKSTSNGGLGGQNASLLKDLQVKKVKLTEKDSHHVENDVESASVNREGFSVKDDSAQTGIFQESSMEKFCKKNMEIFCKAFGDSHYFVKAG